MVFLFFTSLIIFSMEGAVEKLVRLVGGWEGFAEVLTFAQVLNQLINCCCTSGGSH